MEDANKPEEPHSRKKKWFNWQDLILPLAPGLLNIVCFFYTWHPLFLVVGLTFFALYGVVIAWRLGKLQ